MDFLTAQLAELRSMPDTSPARLAIREEMIRRFSALIHSSRPADRRRVATQPPILLWDEISRQVVAERERQAVPRPADQLPLPADTAQLAARLAPYQALADQLRSYRTRSQRLVNSPWEQRIWLVRENQAVQDVLLLVADRLMSYALEHVRDAAPVAPVVVLNRIAADPEIQRLFALAQTLPLEADSSSTAPEIEPWMHVARFLWGLLPILGDVTDLAEATLGVDVLTQQRLTPAERVVALLLTLVPLVSGSAVRRGGEELQDAARRLARRTPGRSAEEWLRLLRAADALTGDVDAVRQAVARLRRGEHLAAAELDHLLAVARRVEQSAGRAADSAAATARATPTLAALEQAAARAAGSDAAARQGLQQLRQLVRHPASRHNILALVPDEHLVPFLQMLTTRGLPRGVGQEVAFYQVLARSPQAQQLLHEFGDDGSAILFRLLRIQGPGAHSVQLVRAAPDITRVLQASAAARASLRDRGVLNRLTQIGQLDRILGIARPRRAVEVVADTADPHWAGYLQQATAFVRAHPQLAGLLDRGGRPHLERLATLRQTLARAGDYARHPYPDRIRLLDEFDQAAASIPGMERVWINRDRGALAERLFIPAQSDDVVRTRWLGGRLHEGGGRDFTIPDYALPPVRRTELTGTVRAREWVELKSNLIDSGPRGADGAYRAGVTAAELHLADAVQDLANLPAGSTLSLHYVRDPGEETRRAMMRVLAREPRVARVNFAGAWYDLGPYRAARP